MYNPYPPIGLPKQKVYYQPPYPQAPMPYHQQPGFPQPACYPPPGYIPPPVQFPPPPYPYVQPAYVQPMPVPPTPIVYQAPYYAGCQYGYAPPRPPFMTDYNYYKLLKAQKKMMKKCYKYMY